MSVSEEALYLNLPWRGYDDPSLPEGVWWGTVLVAGDASGGSQTATIQFKQEGQAISGDIFSLEELNAFAGVSSELLATLRTTNMAPFPGAAFPNRFYSMVLKDMAASNGSTALRGGRGGDEGMMKLPTMLGAASGGAGAVAAVGVEIGNQGVGVGLAITAMGYRWGPRSVLAPGGPQRPARSVFGG